MFQPVRANGATNAGTHCSLVARTNMCGWAITLHNNLIPHNALLQCITHDIISHGFAV